MNNKFYRALYRIRRVEEEIAKVYPSDKIKSPVHLSIGQESISVGVCAALADKDVVFGTYRGHALYLAKGGNLKKMIAELYGKATGCAKGKGGSMHLVDFKAGVMGASAVVGTTIPQAVGYALAMKLRGEKNLVVSFFGDGALEEGVFHESMNFAATKKLPIIFICENNNYAIHSHRKKRQSFKSIADFVASYGVSSQRVEDGNIFTIYNLANNAVKKLRENIENGPIFIECITYRIKEHVGPNEDFSAGYRSIKEAERWLENDQVKVLGKLLDKKTKKIIESEVDAEISDAFEFAEKSPFPKNKELFTDVYA